jgi:hypothetical protein
MEDEYEDEVISEQPPVVLTLQEEIFIRFVNFIKIGYPQVLVAPPPRPLPSTEVIKNNNNSNNKFVGIQYIGTDKWTTVEEDILPDYIRDTEITDLEKREKAAADADIPLPKINPSYMYITNNGRRDKEKGSANKKTASESRMVTLNELITSSMLSSSSSSNTNPNNNNNNNNSNSSDQETCNILLEEEDIDILLDPNANTAFEYYITVAVTLNPTIAYYQEREYEIIDLPPTFAPTTTTTTKEEEKEKSSLLRSPSLSSSGGSCSTTTRSILTSTLTTMIATAVIAIMMN